MSWREAMVFGEKANALLASGQIWRLASAGLLHASPVHIGTSVACLFLVVPALEARFRWPRVVVTAAVAGVVGGAVSWAAGGPSSVGASASLLGVAAFGAVVSAVRGSEWGRAAARRDLGIRCALVIVALLVGGALSVGVDDVAHIGGLGDGAALGAVVAGPERAWNLAAAIAVFVVTVAIGSLVAEWLACGLTPVAFDGCYGHLF